MLWIALHLPALPLEALAEDDGLPRTDGPGPGRCAIEHGRVLVADAAATAAGVVPGLSAAGAQALCPGLLRRARRPDREAALQHLLALALGRYTPQLVWQPAGMLFEVAGSLRLFGGLLALGADLRRLLAELGVSARIAMAPTAAAASWFARLPKPDGRCIGVRSLSAMHKQLSQLPLQSALLAWQAFDPASAGRHVTSISKRALTEDKSTASPSAPKDAHAARKVPRSEACGAVPAPARSRQRSPSEVRSRRRASAAVASKATGSDAASLATLLRGLGCQRLADVRALPRDGLARRGAAGLLAALDRAWGDAPEVHALFEPPPHFDAAIELPARADDAAMLGFAAQRLVAALAGWLQARWRGATRATLWLRHETRGRHACAPTPLRIDFGQPTRDAAQIGLLLRERLARCTLAAPVVALALELDESTPWPGAAAGLFVRSELPDAAGDAADLAGLLARLRARLGDDAVHGIALHPDHRPEHATRLTRVSPLAEGGSGSKGQPGTVDGTAMPLAPHGADRPAWLLPAPQPLVEAGGRPLLDRAPLRLRSAAERIEAGWFDGAPACRDYHVAEAADGRLCWIFRSRTGTPSATVTTAPADAGARWFLHGWFA